MTKEKAPKYTLGEEIVNAITHGIGAIFGVVALVLTIVFSIKNKKFQIVKYTLSVMNKFIVIFLLHFFN